MARIDISSVSASFAKNYLNNSPNATKQDLQVGLKNHLQELKKNGAKISDKQIAVATANVDSLFKVTSEELKANTLSNVSPQTEANIEKLKAQQAKSSYPAYNAHLRADHHYDEFNNMSSKARHRAHKRNLADAKAAFSGEEFAQEEPKAVSNNQNKKAQNADYQSSKKRKLSKKRNEQLSQKEHNRWRNKKSSRNSAYCTSQGIMTKPARNIYDGVKNKLDGSVSVTIDERPNTTLQRMSEYYQKLENASESTKPQTPKVPIEPITIDKPPKPVTKEMSKGKIGLMIGLGIGILGLAGILSSSKKEVPKEVINEVA